MQNIRSSGSLIFIKNAEGEEIALATVDGTMTEKAMEAIEYAIAQQTKPEDKQNKPSHILCF
jgi:phosphotransferase system HPr-like phosphotransfer protein